MPELARQVQALVLAVATSVDLWRDAAIVVLAGVVIGCLWFYAEAIGS